MPQPTLRRAPLAFRSSIQSPRLIRSVKIVRSPFAGRSKKHVRSKRAVPGKRSGRRGVQSDRRHAPYEEFYGLREPPFSIDADPRFIFHGQSYDRVAQQVLDAIRQRDGIAILTGAKPGWERRRCAAS